MNEGHCRQLSRLYFPPKRCSCSDFIFSDSLFNNDTGTDLPFCLEDGSRSDSVRWRLERAVQRESSNAVRKFNQICENKSEICRKFWILWKKFTIFQNYSLHSLLSTRPSRQSERRSSIRRSTERGRITSTLERGGAAICEGLPFCRYENVKHKFQKALPTNEPPGMGIQMCLSENVREV